MKRDNLVGDWRLFRQTQEGLRLRLLLKRCGMEKHNKTVWACRVYLEKSWLLNCLCLSASFRSPLSFMQTSWRRALPKPRRQQRNKDWLLFLSSHLHADPIVSLFFLYRNCLSWSGLNIVLFWMLGLFVATPIKYEKNEDVETVQKYLCKCANKNGINSYHQRFTWVKVSLMLPWSRNYTYPYSL